MTDNELIQIFRPIIIEGLLDYGFANVSVKQSYQPTQQGININPTVYFFKVGNRRYGFLGRYSKWINSEMQGKEIQYIESTYQVTALVLQSPLNINAPTASDLINAVGDVMQSSKTCGILNTSGIGILRIQNVLNPYFQDDRDNFEAASSLEFTFVFENNRTFTEPIVTPPIVQDLHGV